MSLYLPQDENGWQLNTLDLNPTCKQNLKTEVVIIGGGMAGLSAAQAFAAKGKKVVILEQYYCGAGATGKSSGFITPNAELSFSDFSKKYNPEIANQIWQFITSGVDDIRNNILKYNFNCDYAPQDTMMVASSPADFKKLALEHENLTKFSYKTALYNCDQLTSYLGSNQYFGGVSYQDTFGINGFLYCQELKKQLEKFGVLIFEETTVTNINKHTIQTAHANLSADLIIVCTDRFMPELKLLTQNVYHAQTFLMRSEKLTDLQVRKIFPQANLLVWDSELVYNYFRITPDNRLLLGGGSVLNTYASKPGHDSSYMFKKLTSYFKAKFPDLDLQFKQMWPGLMGLSKDIAPLAGRDQTNPDLYYITAAAGLPIAAALGRYSAENLLENRHDLDAYFSPYRPFTISGNLQKVLGNQLTFALCNLIKKNIP